jgi:hypothetical protein
MKADAEERIFYLILVSMKQKKFSYPSLAFRLA